MRIQSGGQGVRTPSPGTLKNHKNIGVSAIVVRISSWTKIPRMSLFQTMLGVQQWLNLQLQVELKLKVTNLLTIEVNLLNITVGLFDFIGDCKIT